MHEINVKRIQPQYPTLDTVIAVADVLEFGADPTGQTDSTAAVQAALDAAKAHGGGTVWVPKGQYLLTDTVTVFSLCTLRGDWNDPDAEDFNGDYGTVILARPVSEDCDQKGLIDIQASAGVCGLTVYYPEQDIKNVKPYPYTFYINMQTLAMVRNCTLINAYRGLGSPGKDKCTVKNLKGTCLKEGVHVKISTDIGYYDHLTLTPDYWANAKGAMKNADPSEIIAWAQAHDSAGLTVHDVEQSQFCHITVRGYTHGVKFPCEPTRFMGSGPMFDVNIDDCINGIYAEEGTYKSSWNYVTDRHPILTSIDWRCGYNITKGRIAGSEYAIRNDSPSIAPLEKGMFADGKVKTGCVRLSGVTLEGKTCGKVYYTQLGEEIDLSGYTVETNRKVKSDGCAFEWLTDTAGQAEIQAALDKVGAAGGGVVYLAAGDYYLTSGLRVPANTELHGAAASPIMVATCGTVLWVRIPGEESFEKACEHAPLITLDGDQAGISGLYLMYDENIYLLDETQQGRYYNYAVQGRGKHVFVFNCCIMGCTHGVLLDGCDDHVLEHIFTACVERSYVIKNSNDGLLLDCLGNGVYQYCSERLNVIRGGKGQYAYLAEVGRKNTHHILLEDCQGMQLVNDFIFCARTLLQCNNVRELVAVNACSDSLTSYLYEFDGGSATVLNSVQTNGNGYRNQGCRLTVLNAMSLFPDDDRDVSE